MEEVDLDLGLDGLGQVDQLLGARAAALPLTVMTGCFASSKQRHGRPLGPSGVSGGPLAQQVVEGLPPPVGDETGRRDDALLAPFRPSSPWSTSDL